MSYRDLSVHDAARQLGSFTLIDVREPDEFVGALGHVAGATLHPVGGIAAAAADWDRNASYLLICRSGVRSVRAAGVLSAMGFTSLTNLLGGMLAWNDAGLPTTK